MEMPIAQVIYVFAPTAYNKSYLNKLHEHSAYIYSWPNLSKFQEAIVMQQLI
jgi:hypothetical protein